MFEAKVKEWVDDWTGFLRENYPVENHMIEVIEHQSDSERPLNACQQAALEKLVGSSWNFASVIGAAGTGKTYTLLRILKALKIPYLLLAPTNQAAKRMAESVGERTSTIAKALGKIPVITDKGDAAFESITQGTLGTTPLTVIDEVSMIDAATMNELRKYLGVTRYLGLGDICQLPPINERQSQFFEGSDVVAELTEVMRYGGYIADQAQSLREVVRYNLQAIQDPSEPLKTPCIVPDGQSVKIISQLEARKLFREYYQVQQEMGVTEFCKVIAYRNKVVADYNKVIKAQLYGWTEHPFIEGQPLVATRPIVRYQQTQDSKGRVRSGSVILLNKADECFIVSKIERSAITAIDIEDYKLSSKNWQWDELEFLNFLVGLPCYRFTIDGGDLGMDLDAKVLTPESLAVIQKTKDDLWRSRNEFYSSSKRRITSYLNSFSDALADPYAITGHMSQGSGFGASGGAVFLAWHDMTNVPSMLKTMEQKRNHQLMFSQLAYTAATRIQEGGTLYLIQ